MDNGIGACDVFEETLSVSYDGEVHLDGKLARKLSRNDLAMFLSAFEMVVFGKTEENRELYMLTVCFKEERWLGCILYVEEALCNAPSYRPYFRSNKTLMHTWQYNQCAEKMASLGIWVPRFDEEIQLGACLP